MVQGCEPANVVTPARRAPQVSYRLGSLAGALREPGVLAAIGFGGQDGDDDPRCLQVPLEPLESPAPLELWHVDGPVRSGREGEVRWSCGGGWLFAALDVAEAAHGGPEQAATHAYATLCGFLDGRPERHVQRLWNYLGAINDGHGDEERYKRFCAGRAAGMGDFFADGFPAATAIGHHAPGGRLLVYLLACDTPGERVENPRQVSAWRYPRQYGPTPPSFARAMRLPAGDALAISGTAAVVGHASAHHDDLQAQLEETFANLESLLRSGHMATGFDTRSPMKAYVRHASDAAHVRAFCNQRAPGVPVLLLLGDVCRQELLVEIDGWRYA